MPHRRFLTLGEWDALSKGLTAALRAANCDPVIVRAPHPGALISKLWRAKTPVLTRGPEIWWPSAPPDLSIPGLEFGMAILQHEAQHALEYAQGVLKVADYLIHPSNWTYDYALKPGCRWCDYGAEQRASIVENLWWLERSGDPAELAAHRRIIPWIEG